jgi:hypothetical protein
LILLKWWAQQDLMEWFISIGLQVGIGLKTRENRAQWSERAAEWAVLGGEGAHKGRFVGVDFSDDTLYGS